jgi:hypothetical protein
MSTLPRSCVPFLALLYDGLGPACTQCGRRFRTDEDGKKKKMAHMDWHFRVHQRIAEAEKRGQYRNWYVTETVSRYHDHDTTWSLDESKF